MTIDEMCDTLVEVSEELAARYNTSYTVDPAVLELVAIAAKLREQEAALKAADVVIEQWETHKVTLLNGRIMDLAVSKYRAARADGT